MKVEVLKFTKNHGFHENGHFSRKKDNFTENDTAMKSWIRLVPKHHISDVAKADIKYSNMKRKQRREMNVENTESEINKHTVSRPIIMWILSRIITVSFCLNLHDIFTCVQITCKFVLNFWSQLQRVQFGWCRTSFSVYLNQICLISSQLWTKNHSIRPSAVKYVYYIIYVYSFELVGHWIVHWNTLCKGLTHETGRFHLCTIYMQASFKFSVRISVILHHSLHFVGI